MDQRVVIPELLDHLPADDPEALRSRRDLRRINFLMGNERWICRSVCRFPEEANRGIVEIGAGDGNGGVLVANLFLHHFEGAQLTALGRWFENFEVLLFNEPNRAKLPHLLGGLMHPWLNPVTRHDMHVSIRAGFAGGEITRLLGLDPDRWRTGESSTWRGARRVVILTT